MKKIHYLLGLMVLSGAILTSCAKEVELSGPEDGSGGGNGNGDVPAYVVTEDEAVAQVEELMDVLDGTPTRSGIRRRIASVEPVGGSPVTRAAIGAPATSTRAGEEEEPLYWVVNFADNEGFALASGDERTTPVFCITEDGNLDAATLDMDNYTEHPGLGIMFSQYDAEYRMTTGLPVFNYETESWVNPEDEGYPQVEVLELASIEPDSESSRLIVIDDLWETIASVGEVIPVKWGQLPPYNKYTPSKDPTGCVATACAIIMAHWEQPQTYNGYTFNWTTMKNGTGYDMVARLMQQLGIPENLDMDYNPTGSGASQYNIARTFENFGYSEGGGYNDYSLYNFIQVFDELALGRPAIMAGCTLRGGKYLGHAWVVDQVIAQQSKIPLAYSQRPLIRTLVHCNWGSDGFCNGYFAPNVWNMASPIIDDDYTVNGDTSYYKYYCGAAIGMQW